MPSALGPMPCSRASSSRDRPSSWSSDVIPMPASARVAGAPIRGSASGDDMAAGYRRIGGRWGHGRLTTVTTWLLVHPPLLGPAVFGPLAAELRSRGNAVRVPDLRPAVVAATGWWDRVAAAAGGPADVVLGFSGAGVVLPTVAAAVTARRVVWLDAVVPAASGTTETPPALRAAVAEFARGDRLLAWTDWWPPEVLAAELPDRHLRALVAAEAPRLPADFHDSAVPVPADWPQDDVRYVQLSPAYDGHAAEARRRGWTVAGDGSGRHLDVAGRPEHVADLLT
jgi:hypothetical protein